MNEKQEQQAIRIGNALGHIVQQVAEHGTADDFKHLEEELAVWFDRWLRVKEVRDAAKN